MVKRPHYRLQRLNPIRKQMPFVACVSKLVQILPRAGCMWKVSVAGGTWFNRGGAGITPLPWERRGSRGTGGEASARASNGWRVRYATGVGFCEGLAGMG